MRSGFSELRQPELTDDTSAPHQRHRATVRTVLRESLVEDAAMQARVFHFFELLHCVARKMWILDQADDIAERIGNGRHLNPSSDIAYRILHRAAC